jgi:hypothetical protein
MPAGETSLMGTKRQEITPLPVRFRTVTGIETAIGCHTFRAYGRNSRAAGITDCLTNGGRIEVAQRMAGHSNAKNNRALRPAQRLRDTPGPSVQAIRMGRAPLILIREAPIVPARHVSVSQQPTGSLPA